MGIKNKLRQHLKNSIGKSVNKKYLVIDEDGLECLLKNEEERNVGLSISIPVKKVKKRVNVFDED